MQSAGDEQETDIASIVVLLVMIGLASYGYVAWSGFATKDLLADCLSEPGEDVDSCYAAKAIELSSLELCDAIKSEETKGFCYQAVAIKQDDLSVCEQITDGFWSSVCFGEFAIKRNNELLCLKMGTIGERDRCLRTIGNATRNHEICTIIGIDNIRDDCLWDVATQGDTIEDCNILDSLDNSLCRRALAIKQRDYEVCENIASSRIRKDCRFAVGKQIDEDKKEAAIETNNPELCNEITFVNTKRDCEAAFTNTTAQGNTTIEE